MLTKDQINALLAFIVGFDNLTGAWPTVEETMREEFGIDDPEGAITSARDALQELA